MDKYAKGGVLPPMRDWVLAEDARVDLTAHTVSINGTDFPYLLGGEPEVHNAENDVSTLTLTVLVSGDVIVSGVG